MMQASKIKSFDVAMDEEGRGGEPTATAAFKTSLSMSNIMQHQSDQERLRRKKLKKKNKKNKLMKMAKASSKKDKKGGSKKDAAAAAAGLTLHEAASALAADSALAGRVEPISCCNIKSTSAATRSLETCTSTEEIGTAEAYAADAVEGTTRGRGALSRSSPAPTSSMHASAGGGDVRLRSGSCWSDADDEILEFVREETPIDRRSVGLLLPSASVTTTTTTSTTAASPPPSSPPTSPSSKKSNKSSKASSKKEKKLLKRKDKSSKGRKGSSSSSSLADVTSSGGGGGNGASSHDEVRWDARARAAAEDEVGARGTLACKEEADNEEEEEEEEATEEKDDGEGDVDVSGDTDDESGSCSSRYGWQFKNDKLLTGRDWAELYDNMKRHITTKAPWREFAMLDEDASRVYAKRTDDFSCALAPLNFQKNRYGNILPYNQNRVKLAVAEDQSDYVNASYVKLDDALPGFQDKITYIAASAPIPSTVEDFYRMLWETETFGIVMLTRNEEGGRPKCHQYWPEENEKHSHGSFTVTNVEEIENRKHSFLVRRFLVEKAGESREITQYHYLAWPDHGVPDSSEPLEEIIKLINAQMRTVVKSNALKEPTLVAHCSAGIGRTGAFILIHTVLNLLFQEIKEDDAESLARWTSRAPPTIDFVHLVQHMRNQRTCMISQPEQYEFCYQTVLSNLGRALHYTPRKSEVTIAKHDSRAARKASLSSIPRQKSCVLF